MTVYPGDFHAVRARAYTTEEQASIREFIAAHGEDYESLADLLTDWREDTEPSTKAAACIDEDIPADAYADGDIPDSAYADDDTD